MLRGGIEQVAHFFVCCFSKAEEDLGQWRAYADNGRGYSIGFDAHMLEQALYCESHSGTWPHDLPGQLWRGRTA